jgi:hypothetical protein
VEALQAVYSPQTQGAIGLDAFRNAINADLPE